MEIFRDKIAVKTRIVDGIGVVDSLDVVIQTEVAVKVWGVARAALPEDILPNSKSFATVRNLTSSANSESDNFSVCGSPSGYGIVTVFIFLPPCFLIIFYNIQGIKTRLNVGIFKGSKLHLYC